ncbi:hypothetical protein IEQ34_017129 [Dendrobium chrysotoxum]|uniref:Uncharacterized protein n=1 Tax=Dendrobium chrysotoxum TaxID=161865 RepID=A0AAV7FT32_DENCH|nr:hypothetical protein IEQ34_017129 [Dendrobium chrysotoxum]
MDPTQRVGNYPLGPNWCSVNINIPVNWEEHLIRWYSTLAIIRQAIRTYVAWPQALVILFVLFLNREGLIHSHKSEWRCQNEHVFSFSLVEEQEVKGIWRKLKSQTSTQLIATTFSQLTLETEGTKLWTPVVWFNCGCSPHANAYSHHVYNELKMLERFWQLIKEKEIGIFELQWYDCCMVKALASLHKQWLELGLMIKRDEKVVYVVVGVFFSTFFYFSFLLVGGDPRSDVILWMTMKA